MIDHPMADSKRTETDESAPVNPVRQVVFTIMSAGFLLWVAFGQVEARVWVSGRLTMLDRRIASMWQYLGNNLPDLPASAVLSMIYWLSISFFVIGTVAGLWLFLGTSDENPNGDSLEEVHGAHLQHEAE